MPLHPSAVQALLRYRRLRNQHIEVAEETSFFVGSRGKWLGRGLNLRQVDRVFIDLREELAWVNRGAHHAPRVHDLRHTFVVRRMMRWQAEGVDVDQAMLASGAGSFQFGHFAGVFKAHQEHRRAVAMVIPEGNLHGWI